MENQFIELLKDPEMRKIFGVVAGERSIYLRALRTKVEMEPEKLNEIVNRLEKAKYINSINVSPFEDFKSIFVTADGLFAERELKRLKLVI